MGLGVGQALDLWNVEVGVDVGALVSSLGVVRQNTGARLERVMGWREVLCGFRLIRSAYGVDQDRSNAGLLEPSLEASQNGFGPFEVVSVGLEIRMHRVSLRSVTGDWGAYGLEHGIGLSSELLQIGNVVERPKDGLESQLFEDLGLFGRAKVDGYFVFGPLWVLDEVGEGAAADVAWVTISRMRGAHPARNSGTGKTVRGFTYQ